MYAVGGSIVGGGMGYVLFFYMAVLGLIGNAPDIAGLLQVVMAMFVFLFFGLILGAAGGLAVEHRNRKQRVQDKTPPE